MRRLETQGLVRAYGGRVVVAGLDLRVEPGEVVGLLGPNGAGKTTTFQMIAGLVSADEGSVRLGGVLLDGMPLWRRVREGLGYLPQEPSLLRRLSVLDNLRLPLERRGAPVERAMALLHEAGLEHLAQARAGTLSGGERRRIEIARCLATDPGVLLLDEPFSGVDPVTVGQLKQLIVGLARRGLGILLTDHAVHEALGICDRAVILDQGRVMARGAPRQVVADPHVRARYLGAGFRIAELESD